MCSGGVGDSYMSLRDSSAGNQCGCVEASYKDSTVQKVKTQRLSCFVW